MAGDNNLEIVIGLLQYGFERVPQDGACHVPSRFVPLSCEGNRKEYPDLSRVPRLDPGDATQEQRKSGKDLGCLLSKHCLIAIDRPAAPPW